MLTSKPNLDSTTAESRKQKARPGEACPAEAISKHQIEKRKTKNDISRVSQLRKMETIHSWSSIPVSIISFPAVVDISRRLMLNFNLPNPMNTMNFMKPQDSFLRNWWRKKRGMGPIRGKVGGDHRRRKLYKLTLVQLEPWRVWFPVLFPISAAFFVVVYQTRPQCGDCTKDHANTELHPVIWNSKLPTAECNLGIKLTECTEQIESCSLPGTILVSQSSKEKGSETKTVQTRRSEPSQVDDGWRK